MPLLSHGCDALARDGFLARGTECAPGGVVVDLAVRLSLVLIVVPAGERHGTHLGGGGGGGGGTVQGSRMKVSGPKSSAGKWLKCPEMISHANMANVNLKTYKYKSLKTH